MGVWLQSLLFDLIQNGLFKALILNKKKKKWLVQQACLERMCLLNCSSRWPRACSRVPLSGVEVWGWGPRHEDMPGVAPRLRWHGRASRPRTADGGIAPECGLVRPC